MLERGKTCSINHRVRRSARVKPGQTNATASTSRSRTLDDPMCSFGLRVCFFLPLDVLLLVVVRVVLPVSTHAMLLIAATNDAKIPIFKFNGARGYACLQQRDAGPATYNTAACGTRFHQRSCAPTRRNGHSRGTYTSVQLTYGPSTFVVIDRSGGAGTIEVGNYDIATKANQPVTVNLPLSTPLLIKGTAMGLLLDLNIPQSTTFTPYLAGSSNPAPGGGQTTFNPVFSFLGISASCKSRHAPGMARLKMCTGKSPRTPPARSPLRLTAAPPLISPRRLPRSLPEPMVRHLRRSTALSIWMRRYSPMVRCWPRAFKPNRLRSNTTLLARLFSTLSSFTSRIWAASSKVPISQMGPASTPTTHSSTRLRSSRSRGRTEPYRQGFPSHPASTPARSCPVKILPTPSMRFRPPAITSPLRTL